MGRRLAISTLAALLIALVLISVFTGIIIYLSELQMGQPSAGAGTIEEVGEKIREKVDVWFWRYEAPASGRYVFYVNATNTGQTTVKVVSAIFVMWGGSLKTVQLSAGDFYYPGLSPAGSQEMAMLAERVIRVEYQGDAPQSMMLMTERGNTFYVMGFREALSAGQPQFDFEVSVDPESGSAEPGGSVAATVTVRLISGSPEVVTLSVSGLPSGASASLSQQSGLPTFTSTMVISTSPTTPTGTYTITIMGTGGGLSRSAFYTLTASTETFTVTFTQTGLPSGTEWSVAFGGQTYRSTGSTITFTVPAGTYSWSVSTPIPGGSSVRYAASPASGSMDVSSDVEQSVTYIAEYQWAFSASGLGSDASGTVVTIDGTNYAYSDLPATFWWPSGSTHSYAYQQYVGTTVNGKRYANHNPPSGTVTASGPNSLNPSYHAEYLLTVRVSPSGAGSVSLNPPSVDGYYDAGASVTASASANTGYSFSKWQLDGADYSTSNPTAVTMDAPHTLTAVFTGATYTLTVYVYRSGTTTGIQGVTVKVDENSYVTGSDGRVQTAVTYGIHSVEVVSPYSPSSGTRYVFTQWSDGVTSNPRTISVTGDATLTAYMKLQYQLTVNVNPSGSGSVSASPSSSDGYYDAGTAVTLTATASSGYSFDAWTGDSSGTSSSTSVTMDSPKSVTANFFTFSISVNPSSGSTPQGGSVTATVTVTYGSGVNSKSISLSASGLPSGASASFSPSSVTISPSSTTATSTMTISTSSSTPTGTYSITITGSGGGLSKTTAYTLTVTAATYTVNFYIYDDAGNAVSGATLNFAGQSYSHGGSTSVAAGSYSLSTGTIPSGYRFKQWEASGSISIASSTSSSTTATVSGSGSITMRLQRTATVTFSANGLGSDASGTVLTVDGTSYGYSSLPVSFTWDVGSSHSFTWTDYVSAGSGKRYAWVSTSGLSTSRSGTINVPAGGGSVAATYKTQYYLTMQVSPSGGGSVSPSSGWYDAGSSVSISATPSSGWNFERWVGSGSGSYSGSSSSATITMNDPITETAYFYTFSISVNPSSGSVTQGGSTSATVTVTLSGGYSASISVSLSASGLPSSASASFNPSSVTISPSSPTATSTMTISTSYSFDFSLSASPSSLSICRGASKTTTITVSGSSSGTPTGTYSITVTGSGSGLSKSTTYSLTVTAASAPTVSLSASASGSGLSFSFNPSSGTPTFTSTLTISASTSATLGTQTVTVTGSGGGLTRSTTVTVYVNDFSVSANPTSGTVNIPLSDSTSTTATITVASTSGSGSSQTISLSVSGAPSGVSVTLNPTSLTFSPGQSGTSTMTVTVSSSASGGTYTLTITASSDCGASKQATYTLNLRTPILFYAQFWYKTKYYDVYVNPSGYWYGKNIISVDWVPYAPEHFSLYYPTSYGSYALAIWRDVGSTLLYEWYETIYYDVSTAISGIDERYPWLVTYGYVTGRTGSFTVPSRSGTNPVIIRASYDRHIRLKVEGRPTPPSDVPQPGSISETDRVEGNPLDGWYYDSASFTANPNYPYYQFDGSGIGEWHKDYNYGTIYSTSKTVCPRDPMILTADFYPRVRVQTKDYENYALADIGVTIDDATVYTDSNGYASRYIHPNKNAPVSLLVTSASKTVTASGQGRYPDVQLTLTGYFMYWQDGSTSTSRTVYTDRPIDLTATFECGIYVYPGPIYGMYAYILGSVIAPGFPRTYYFTGGSVRSWNHIPVSGVRLKIIIWWRQGGTGIWYPIDLTATSTSSTRYIVWLYYEGTAIRSGSMTYNTATWRADLGNQWNDETAYYAKAWVDSVPTGYRFTGHSIPGATQGNGKYGDEWVSPERPFPTWMGAPYGFDLHYINVLEP